jgi:hypothetical protein
MVSLPQEFFIFVSQVRPEAYLTYKHTKTFTSRFAGLLATDEGRRQLDAGQADPMPFIPNDNMYPDLSPFSVSAMNLYRVEWDAELGRRAHNQMAPSRMSAIFAFADSATCELVASRHNWPLDMVRRFRLAYGVPHRTARVNMEIISLLRAVYPLAMWGPEQLNAFWHHYWTGQGNLDLETPELHNGQNWRQWSSGETWEWLIEGQLVSDDDSPVFA